MEQLRNIGGKLLRCGYTTGTCAAAAAKAAAILLLSGKTISAVELVTPKRIRLTLDVLDPVIAQDHASCAIKKDSGDDPDVTNGVLVYAAVSRISDGIRIDGGEGIGRVTKQGLDQPVGAAAINSVPRRMIENEVREVIETSGYTGGLLVVISIPAGAALARRTFNPRMGIEGGISVIGTTGIVEPMSNQALIDTIRLELRQLAVSGTNEVLLTPGNYGEAFAASLDITHMRHIACSNFIGEAIDAAVENNFTGILLVGHIGKLVKLGIGVTNTHSECGDGRMETLIACALQAGADLPLLQGIAGCVTTDAALALLAEAGLLRATMDALGAKITDTLSRRVPDSVNIGYICFTNTQGLAGVLVKSENTDQFLKSGGRD